MTGGVRFEGDSIQVNCFRASCDASCAYELGSPISKKFREFCRSINVTIPVDLRAIKSSFQQKLQEELESDLYKKNFYSEMKIPSNFIHPDDVPSSKINQWIDYMADRNCSMEDCFYINSGQYKGSLAVACYFYDKLIGFQIINRNSQAKYINESDNQNVIFVNQKVMRSKVIVVEGLLDAKCFPNAVALLGHKVTPEKAFHLRGRDVILLPDKTGGSKFVEAAKDYGWKLSLPEWKEKDLNAAVSRYGVMEVAKMICDNTFNPIDSNIDLMFKLWRDD